MTIRDEIIDALCSQPDGMTDAQLAVRLGKLRQHINQRCRQMASAGSIVRDAATGTIINRLVRVNDVAFTERARYVSDRADGIILSSRSWPHEVAVQGALVGWLARNDWRIVRVANTEAQERGTDVIAERNGVRLLVEVKGYPDTTYVRGPRAGQAKPTQPTLQASHWLASALLKAMRMRAAYRDAHVVVALPDTFRYRSILSEIDESLRGARIEIWLLSERGEPNTRLGGQSDVSSEADSAPNRRSRH